MTGEAGCCGAQHNDTPWHFHIATTLLLQLTILLKLISVVCELPTPVNVTINSSNFIHLLTWGPGPGTPKGVYYNVTFSTERGDPWGPVSGCEHVETPLVCNVTKAFSESHLVYYNQVTAVMGDQVSGAALQTGFKPIAKTFLEPPVLSVEACSGELCVSLKAPVSHLRDMYASFLYTLSIRSNNGQFSVDNVSLRGQILKDLAPGTKYCVSVRISGNLDRRESAFGPPQCVFTNAVSTADSGILIGVCLVLLVFIAIFLLERAGFLYLRPSLPLVLTSLQRQKGERCLVPWDVLPCSPVHTVTSSSALCAKDGDKVLEDHSDEETETEGTGRGSYESRRAANPLCPTSSSLSLFNVGGLTHGYPKAHTVDILSETSVAMTTQPNSPFLEADQLKEPVFTPNSPQSMRMFPCVAEPTALDHEVLWGQNLFLGVFTNTETQPFVPVEEEMEAEKCSQEVNLLSVTLGGQKEEEEEEEEESPGMDVVEEVVSTCNHPLPSPSTYRQRQPVSTQIGTIFVLEEEGEEEKDEDDNKKEQCSGYMSR